MTVQEAVKDIKFIRAAYENLAENGADRYRAVGKNVECVVGVKTNGDLYSHFVVSLGMAAEVMGKQIAKKPKYLPLREGFVTTNYECPICGCRRLGHGFDLDKCYCPECGQKLDWSEV